MFPSTFRITLLSVPCAIMNYFTDHLFILGSSETISKARNAISKTLYLCVLPSFLDLAIGVFLLEE
ncbi:hypothetical protein SYJ56_19125 [Algoriphagus sp. D3-2-R+10]|uniref:hypothetical protein n=1 Tax=Algoriphagus aurantiacus TaxID=3103948 RepID=UPI002B39332C|nr:hypothetical protein [Algoriphagus sp. D3-2-R+10]MEB2777435.1 hypothetical protein [Algoriphagus sp. D3-2-R+10]